MKRLIILVFCLALAAAPAIAEDSQTPGLVEVHLYYVGNTDATAVAFKVEILTPGWFHLGDEWSFSSVIGTSVAGVSIGFGGCMTAPTYLGVARFFADPITCADLRIVGHPTTPSGQIEVVDCNGTLTYPFSDAISAGYEPCGVRPPANLFPADGAVGISLEPTLTWTWEPSTGCPGGIGMITCHVYLGTEPNNLVKVGTTFPSGPLESYEFTAGPLAPATLHYWRVRLLDDYWNCPGSQEAWSATQSFFTLGSVPVEMTTWGRIKGLYR